MKPVVPAPIRLARQRKARREAFADQRPGWLCPKCGGAHGPDVQSCPEGLTPKREVIR